MADGSMRASGIPSLEPERLEAVRAELQAGDPASFGETAGRATLHGLDRLIGDARTGDLTETAARLDHLIASVEGLDPFDLVPRRGLAGLFDSRRRRLKRFRAAYRDATRSLADTTLEIEERLKGVETRSGTLETGWSSLRDALRELNGHVEAATASLPALPAASEETPAPIDAADALRDRTAALGRLQAAALTALPVIRAVQNCDSAALAGLRRDLPAVAAWQEDWTGRLGLDRKRPRKVRPDAHALADTRAALLGKLTRLRELAADARRRRSALVTRLEGLRQSQTV